MALLLLMFLHGTSFLFAQTDGRRRITGREDSIRQQVFAMGLPVVEINTVNREFPHYYSIDAPEGCYGHCITGATKVPGRVTVTLGDSVLFDSGEYEEDVSGMKVKIRGNYTARNPKKPYKVKLQKKADMLRRGDSRYEDKNWLLLTTQSLLADIGVRLSELLDMDWTPSFEHVNLFFNGEYKGNYLLMESVRRNKKCRVDISSDGYLFEYDPYWWNEEVAVQPSIMEWYIQYTFKYPDPDEITAEQLDRFTERIRVVESSLLNDTYPEYLDVTSFARWMLAQDLLGTADYRGANEFLTFYDDTADSKVQMPCLWDFDSALGNVGEWFGWHKQFYFRYLFDSANRQFVEEYLRLYDEVAPTFFDEMQSWISDMEASELAAVLENAVHLDSIRWNEQRDSVATTIRKARQWFADRQVWMAEKTDSIRQTLVPTGLHASPGNVSGRSRHPHAAASSLYNLQGQRLEGISTSPDKHKPTALKGVVVRRGRKYVNR